MIQVKGGEKGDRTDTIETVALTGVNLDVAEGEFISIMGPSGCGKSTLLNVIGLLDAPTQGQVALHGAPIGSYRDRDVAPIRNKEIGFIFQSFHLIADLSVVHNVEIQPPYRPLPAREP